MGEEFYPKKRKNCIFKNVPQFFFLIRPSFYYIQLGDMGWPRRFVLTAFLVFNTGKPSRYKDFFRQNFHFVKRKASVAFLGPKIDLRKVTLFGQLQRSETKTNRLFASSQWSYIQNKKIKPQKQAFLCTVFYERCDKIFKIDKFRWQRQQFSRQLQINGEHYQHRWASTLILMSAISDIRHQHLLFLYRKKICRTENCRWDFDIRVYSDIQKIFFTSAGFEPNTLVFTGQRLTSQPLCWSMNIWMSDFGYKFIPISDIMSDFALFSPISEVPISSSVRYS